MNQSFFFCGDLDGPKDQSEMTVFGIMHEFVKYTVRAKPAHQEGRMTDESNHNNQATVSGFPLLALCGAVGWWLGWVP